MMLQLLVMVGVRKSLDKVFDKSELRILDDVLPESQRQEKLDDEDFEDEIQQLKVSQNMVGFDFKTAQSI